MTLGERAALPANAGREVTYTAERWTFSDGSKLLLDATVTAYISDIQVTLIDAFKDGGGRVQYWQRTALVDWVSCHQHWLRADQAQRTAQ